MTTWLLDHTLQLVFGPLAAHTYVSLGDVGQLSCVATMLRIIDSLFCEHLPAYAAPALPTEGSRHRGNQGTAQTKAFPGVTEKVHALHTHAHHVTQSVLV